MSDDPEEVPPDKGEGRTEQGPGSAPANKSARPDEDGRNGTAEPPPEQAEEERSGGSEIPIGIPMTAEQWRHAKEQAERADSED
jgi:hypothetical protein